jgi:hypothetical protein
MSHCFLLSDDEGPEFAGAIPLRQRMALCRPNKVWRSSSKLKVTKVAFLGGAEEKVAFTVRIIAKAQ